VVFLKKNCVRQRGSQPPKKSEKMVKYTYLEKGGKKEKSLL